MIDTTFKPYEEYEVPKDEPIISRTDLKGIITYSNELFAKISGYDVDELVGKPHNIIRHLDMPKSAYKDMWDTVKKGAIWKGYVKNRRKDGSYYWVFAEVSSVIKDGKIVEYKSMRYFVPKEKRYEMQERYDRLREQEEGVYRVCMYVTKEQLATLQLADLHTSAL